MVSRGFVEDPEIFTKQKNFRLGWHRSRVRASHPAAPGSILRVPEKKLRKNYLGKN